MTKIVWFCPKDRLLWLKRLSAFDSKILCFQQDRLLSTFPLKFRPNRRCVVPCIPYFKILTKSVVRGSLHSPLKVWTDSAVLGSLPFLFNIRSYSIVRGYPHPLFKIRTESAVHGSLKITIVSSLSLNTTVTFKDRDRPVW